MSSETATRLMLHEHVREDGEIERTWLEVEDGELRMRHGDGPLREVPVAVLEAVMHRYGKPLAQGIVIDGPALSLPEGRSARMLRHRGFYDVIAKDYFVYAAPGHEPLAELATSVTAALSYLLKK